MKTLGREFVWIIGWSLGFTLLVACVREPQKSRSSSTPAPTAEYLGPGSEVGNGGTYVHLLMDQAKLYAATLASRFIRRPMPNRLRAYLSPDDWKWLTENQARLSEDLRTSRLVWVKQLPAQCSTESCGCAPVPGIILLSESNCESSIHNRHQAVVLLTHETIHHLEGNDESRVKHLTSAFFTAWEGLGHSEFPHWSPIPRNLYADLPPPGAVWSGKELIHWRDWGTDRYDPVTNQWHFEKAEKDSELSNGGKRRQFGFLPGIYAGGKVLVFEEDYEEGYRDVGYTSGHKVLSETRHDPKRELFEIAPSKFDDVGGELDLKTNRWSGIPRKGAPSPRLNAHIIQAGDKLLVWGGFLRDRGPWQNDGGIYDPKTRTWDAIPPGPMPLRPYRASILWAGGKLIIWGGHPIWWGDVKYSNEGWIYDSATHTWTDMETENAPAPRAGAVMVWAPEAGNAVIVYGGYNGWRKVNGSHDDFLRSGGIFDLDKKAWRKDVHLEGGPAPVNHVLPESDKFLAAWDGVQMIGIGEDLAFYNPFIDRWESGGRAASPFYIGENNLIFWTGIELILWNTDQQKGQLFYP